MEKIKNADVGSVSFAKDVISSVKKQITSVPVINSDNEIIIDNCIEVDYKFKDISVILDDELFTKFLKKLGLSDFDEDVKDYMKDLAITSMMGVKK